jgi:prefoldin subunit 5
MASSDIEKKSLEAHVELCAERYNNLDQRLKSFDERMDNIEKLIIDLRGYIATATSSAPNDTNKTLIAIGTTILGALIGVIGTLIVHIK